MPKKSEDTQQSSETGEKIGERSHKTCLVFSLIVLLILVILLVDWRDWKCQVAAVFLAIIIFAILLYWEREPDFHRRERDVQRLCNEAGVDIQIRVVNSDAFGYGEGYIYIPEDVSDREFSAMTIHALAHLITRSDKHNDLFRNSHRYLSAKKNELRWY